MTVDINPSEMSIEQYLAEFQSEYTQTIAEKLGKLLRHRLT